MNRREAISKVALLVGGSVIGAEMFMNLACSPHAAKVNDLFDEDQMALLDEVAETILPATSTPGAKEAGVGRFMTVMVQDCYTPEDQKVFLKGLSDLDGKSKKEIGKGFMDATPQQRTALLTRLDKEQKDWQEKKPAEAPNHYFTMMKQLTLLGFFTSEVGATKALRYIAVPGRFDGCIPYKKGDRAWAT